MAIVNSDTNHAALSDHLNTRRRMTGSDGALVWQWGHSAFGEEQPSVATRKLNKVAAIDGDLEMNLRLTQEDPIGLAGGWNRFGYVCDLPPHIFWFNAANKLEGHALRR